MFVGERVRELGVIHRVKPRQNGHCHDEKKCFSMERNDWKDVL
jgi:hypothetical protein